MSSEQAALNDANASSFPDTEPSATQSCPLAKGIILGVFFDGTSNNKYKDTALGKETNVARLWTVYKETEDERYVREKLYIIGPGAVNGKSDQVEVAGTKPSESGGWWNRMTGMAFGFGAKDRLNIAYNWVKSKAAPHKPPYDDLVDVYGFSRGASLSRTFVNLINQAMKKKDVPNLDMRFLGIFDTVGSWLLGESKYINEGLVPSDARSWAHFTAKEEHRLMFPLSVLSSSDKQYSGIHSDVGGGIKDHTPTANARNSMAFVTCNHMWVRSTESNVDIAEPSANGVNVAELYAESQKYDGTASADPSPAFQAQRKAWLSEYVHDSVSLEPWNWSNIGGKRRIIHPGQRKIGAFPPNFSWKG
jgi:Uncharacterized alpha/beta hydrolase domain (DUF2235)